MKNLNEQSRIVFISHYSHEERVALALQEAIEKPFLGLIKCFVSSDNNSVVSGHDFGISIKNGIRNSIHSVILLSPESIKRPWVNYEYGALDILDKPITGILHGGFDYNSKLPEPYDRKEFTYFEHIKGLEKLALAIASSSGVAKPEMRWDGFVTVTKSYLSELMNGKYRYLAYLLVQCMEALNNRGFINDFFYSQHCMYRIGLEGIHKCVTDLEETGYARIHFEPYDDDSYSVVPADSFNKIMKEPVFKKHLQDAMIAYYTRHENDDLSSEAP